MPLDRAKLKQRASELGFNMLGITRAKVSPTLDAYMRWIETGMHGKMGYMARPDRVARRLDLNVIVPEAKTLIMVGLDYRTDAVPLAKLNDPTRGRIANYAWHVDYHDIMTPRLQTFADWLAQESATMPQSRVYVDTGAILERSHAQQAGMGFIGKNTMLIHPRRGSFFFLGEIITSLEFDDYDTPHRPTMCGTCTRCLNACPKDAFPQPHVLDARLCISYHTIENKGWIDRDLRAQFGNWLYGCDVCQDVCPFQRFAPLTQERAFYPPDDWHTAPRLSDVLQLDDATFKQIYANSPIARIKRQRLVRNACIASGNSGNSDLAPLLRHLITDESELVRGHALWALVQLLGDNAYDTVRQQKARETDADVLAEIDALLA
jgi:epoxyqueuosine reductase